MTTLTKEDFLRRMTDAYEERARKLYGADKIAHREWFEAEMSVGLDAIWPEIEKYQKFVAAVIELGPDGVTGMVDYLLGNTVPFDPEQLFDE